MQSNLGGASTASALPSGTQGEGPLRICVSIEDAQESFKFGHSGRLSSSHSLSVMIGSVPVWLWISTVQCEQLGLLSGKGVLSGLGIALDFDSNQMDVRALKLESVLLGECHAGHLRLLW